MTDVLNMWNISLRIPWHLSLDIGGMSLIIHAYIYVEVNSSFCVQKKEEDIGGNKHENL